MELFPCSEGSETAEGKDTDYGSRVDSRPDSPMSRENGEDDIGEALCKISKRGQRDKREDKGASWDDSRDYDWGYFGVRAGQR